ncbi:MAG: 2-oxoacid:acceptor oxidoreductase subunit alpha [Anaerolineae bacterium]|nr:2-oxoacid:acceptor oxidoreductase subunit alpha [Anaerolineae bacterium]
MIDAGQVDLGGGKRPLSPSSPLINNFSIVVASANGTGSQTANLALLRACCNMGITVNSKNIFPSNIQGMPTWYHIRLSEAGYVAHRASSEILVAFNETTVHADIQKLPAGGMCIVNDDWHSVPQREDITMYAIPVKKFVAASGLKGKPGDYIANMVYVGAVAQLLGIPLAQIEAALTVHFSGKQKLVESNLAVVESAFSWTAENISKTDPFSVKPISNAEKQILITGNEAAALGSIFGGVSFVAWYPITPSTGVVDALNTHLPTLRRDPETGEATYAVVQAEDELAAIGMILGAGWAGARAMTATSGPGISLMAEFAGLGYFAEVPAVIWDVQRVGPSTGLPTRTGQGDIISTYYLGHGDTENVLLFPASARECFEMGIEALNLADELQTPIFVMSDLDLGMNTWMSPPFTYPTEPMKRGKVLHAEDLGKNGRFSRYLDVDGDGITYRTLPGNQHPQAAWFARGTGHNEHAVYSERPEDWEHNMARLKRKFNTARDLVPAPVVDERANAAFGIIAFGTTCYAIDEARDQLADEGITTSFMRLRALPINDDVRQFVSRYGRIYVIELNRDGQMHKILQTELPEYAARLVSLAHMDGMPLTTQWIRANLS